MNLKKLAFTLAEVMIIVTVIGIISAILLPAARNAAPDKNITKFKKANNTFGNVIRELAYDEKYFYEGDLNLKPDGTEVTNKKYICQCLADILNTKKVECSEYEYYNYGYVDFAWDKVNNEVGYAANILDKICREAAIEMGTPEIITSDNVHWYQGSPAILYNRNHITQTDAKLFQIKDDNGKLRIYKAFCIDIDGKPDGATKTNCINECPFGYGVRQDGKILYGLRAQQWMKKKIQRGD